MDKKKNKEFIRLIRKTIWHFQVWLLLFLLSYFILRNDRFQIDLKDKIFIWLIYIGAFYANYLFLFKFLFYKKKYIFYFSTALIFIFFSTVAVKSIKEKYFERRNHFEPPTEINRMPKPPEFGMDNNFVHNPFDPPKRFPMMVYLPSLLNLVLIFTASGSLRLYEKWRENEELQDMKEKEKIKTELLFLKQQINPHFLFNSLNNIYSLALVKSELTTEAILKLSSILRYILYKSNENTVSLSEELEIVQDYIDLQRLRLTKQVDLNYKLDCENNSFKIEPFILLPIIENCFKYGVDNMNKSIIDIAIYLQENKLTLVARNTLFKRLQNRDSESSGIGIGNIVRRLDLLYPDKYTFINEEKGDYYSVVLTIILSE
jgi:hypothetical protein